VFKIRKFLIKFKVKRMKRFYRLMILPVKIKINKFKRRVIGLVNKSLLLYRRK